MNTPRVKISDSRLEAEDEPNHKLRHCIIKMAVFMNASLCSLYSRPRDKPGLLFIVSLEEFKNALAEELGLCNGI